MNIGIICDVSSNLPVGVIGTDNNSGDIGFATSIQELEDILETVIFGELELLIEDRVDESTIVRSEKVNSKNPNYLMALNYHLPYPWKILGVRFVEGNLEDCLEEAYQYMEGLQNEGQQENS